MHLTHIISTFEVYEPSAVDAIALLSTLLKLQPSSLNLWSNTGVAKEYERQDISIIKPYAGAFPATGDLIVLGARTRIGHWYQYQNFQNVTLVHLDMTQEIFYQTMHQITGAGKHAVNIIYANQKIKGLIGLDGAVLSN